MDLRTTLAAILAASGGAGHLLPAQVPATVPALRTQADSLLRQRSFDAAAGLYRQILEADSTQIAVLMGLGRATSGAGRIDEAIGWYRRALDAGAAPQNLIAYLLAQLHARRGERDSAIAWLDRSLAFRLERRSQIAVDSVFARWRDDPEFRRLAGLAPGAFPDRVAGWTYDIDYLVAEARRMHAGPDRPAHQPPFARAAEELKSRISSLSDTRMAAEIQRLLAMLGDGHSVLYPVSSAKVIFTRVPLDLWWFSDGLTVVNADDGLSARIGQRIVAIGGVPVAEALRRIDPYVSRDNPMGPLVLGSFLLTVPAFAEAAGLTEDGAVAYTFQTREGGREEATLAAAGFRAPSFKLGPAPGSGPERPLSFRHPDVPHWLELLPAQNAVYLQYNQVQDGPALTVAQFADSLTRTLRRSGARHLIVDVRRNNGGNNGLNRPLVRAMVAFEMQPGHRLWVLTSRTTFSAAQNFINQVERWTDATFVGEPSGSKPNFAGEDTELLLPYSGLRGSISTRWWQDSGPLDRRQWIAPHQSVGVRSTDYFANRDPVLEAVLEALDRRQVSSGPDTVVVHSGALELRGLVWRPPGRGPFPAVLFNHGSGQTRATASDERNRAQGAAALGPVFARHGYVFLFLFRRGSGLSAGQGTYSGDLRERELAARGQEAHDRLQVRLLEIDELNDALAGLKFLRALHEVDARRVAVAGHSFGGSLTLLVAERDSTLRAAVDFAGAAGSWRSPPLRARLLSAVARTAVPVFFVHAANDYSVAPGEALAEEMARLGKPHRVEIYPPFGRTAADGHSFVYLSVTTWEPDVFAFLDECMRR